MANNLKDHLKEVADAIRAKKGTSELINPQDFATEIEGISGGGESGGSNWRYFDTTKAAVTAENRYVISLLFPIFKTNDGLYKKITCSIPLLGDWEAKYVVATATDFNLKIYIPDLSDELMTIGEYFNSMGGVEALEQALGFTEITKEQFYDLNA